tara:strand:+ start:509 stop:1354 length:846 start_codon:yes stop_codon:yes gene_type:complete
MNTELLPKELQEVLTEESVTTIETAIKEKVELSVEAALASQDELYAEKLEELVSAIDKDHTSKLGRVVEAVDTSNAKKLIKVVNKYENDLNKDAGKFKATLVESISDYIEEYIDDAIPTQAIEEATRNRTASEVLSNLRSVLAVDSSLMKESVKGAVIEGKNQIDELTAKLNKIEKENGLLKEAYKKTQADLFLEQKTSSLPAKKKEYLNKVLGDKSPKFIKENFDYTERLFDKKELERIDVIKEQAFDNRKIKTDAPREVVVEKKVEITNPYLSELERMK